MTSEDTDQSATPAGSGLSQVEPLAMTEVQSRLFWSRVARGSEDDCWPWIAALKDGYGRFSLNGRTVGAHRITCFEKHGVAPEGHVVDHKCRNRRCVNPAHLRYVTRFTNVHENSDALAHLNSLKTHCPNGHELSGENLLISKWSRVCRQCRNEQQRQRAKLKKRYDLTGRHDSKPGSFNREKTHCIRGHELSGDNLWIKPDGKRRCRACHNAWNVAYQARKKANVHG